MNNKDLIEKDTSTKDEIIKYIRKKIYEIKADPSYDFNDDFSRLDSLESVLRFTMSLDLELREDAGATLSTTTEIPEAHIDQTKLAELIDKWTEKSHQQ